MRRCGPDHIARRTRRLAAEAVAEFDTSELTTGMTAAFTHNATRTTLLRRGTRSRPASAVARRPPALTDAKGSALQFVAEQFKPDEKVARVDWGRIGVGGYRFEPGNDASATRLHIGIRRHHLL
jgi:hypothetical protein